MSCASEAIGPMMIERYHGPTSRSFRTHVSQPELSPARLRSRVEQHHWFLIMLRPLQDDHGQVLRWYATAIDRKGRKRAEEALAKALRQIKQLKFKQQKWRRSIRRF